MVELFQEIFSYYKTINSPYTLYTRLKIPGVPMWINYVNDYKYLFIDVYVPYAANQVVLKNSIKPKDIKEWLTALRQLTERVDVEW